MVVVVEAFVVDGEVVVVPVVEVPVDLGHRVTGTSWRDQRHRARQYRDVWRALAARGIYRLR